MNNLNGKPITLRLVANLCNGQPGAQAAWQSAAHVEAAPKPKPKPPTPTPTP